MLPVLVDSVDMVGNPITWGSDRVAIAPPVTDPGQLHFSGSHSRCIVSTVNLHEVLDRVRDRQSFLTFVGALERDRHAEVLSGTEAWQNSTIESFLEAAAAWAGEAPSAQFPEQATWRAFANFLFAGKFYE